MVQKPVIVFEVTDIDFVGVDPGINGAVRILFDTSEKHAQHIALVLPPEVVAKLETRLEQVRQELAKRTPKQ